MSDWIVRSKNGRVSVLGSRVMFRGAPRDRLSWNDLEGKRHQTMIAVDPANDQRAMERAQVIAEEVAGDSTTAGLARSDVQELLAARDALIFSGMAVDVVAREYAEALRVLDGCGGSVLDAARFFAKAHITQSVSMEDCVADFMGGLERKGRSVDYVKTFRKFSARVLRQFPDRMVVSISAAEIEAWLYEIAAHLAPKSFNNYLTSMVTIFNFAMKRGWCAVNPAASIDRRSVKRNIEVYSQEEISKILNGLDGYFVPWVVLQCFGCLRAAEVARVRWGTNIKLDRAEPVIRVTEDVAKGDDGQPRIVYLQPNVVRWLKPLAGKDGERVYPGDFEKVLSSLWDGLSSRRSVVGVPTLRNGLRKTCASNLAAILPAAEAAEMMGHSLKKLKQNYQEMITRDEAELYWKI